MPQSLIQWRVVLDCLIQQQIVGSHFNYSVTNRLGMALFSNESILHYPSVLFQRGCVLYNRKGRSVFPSLCTNGTITVNNGVLSHTENVLPFHTCSPLCL